MMIVRLVLLFAHRARIEEANVFDENIIVQRTSFLQVTDLVETQRHDTVKNVEIYFITQ